MPISGRGPQGERAFPAERLRVSEDEAQAIRQGRFRVAIVLRNSQSEWARQVLGGLSAILGHHAASLTAIVDCQRSPQIQAEGLQALAQQPVDAVISVPIGAQAAAGAHGALIAQRKVLCFLDAAPQGMESGRDYASVVSADNFGLGELAARMLSPHIGAHGTVALVTLAANFFATNEREIGFRKWVGAHRPDLSLVRARYDEPEQADASLLALLRMRGLDGVFAAWDGPAMRIVSALRGLQQPLPMTCVDLGSDVAAALQAGDIVKGVAAQRPFALGQAVGLACLMKLIGLAPPRWIAVSGLEVTRDRVIESYQSVWHAPVPDAMRRLISA